MALFSSPLPRGRQSFYFEGSALRSNRDSDSVPQQWYKNQSTSQQNDWVANTLAKMQTDINRLRRRVLPLIQSFDVFHPFKIYQPNNAASFIGQTAPMFVTTVTDYGSFGNPLSCLLVNAQTPTNLAAMPPQVSVADTWRFFSVRSGLVEFRPLYSALSSNPPASYFPFDPNNWGAKFGGYDAPPFSGIANTDLIGLFADEKTFDEQTEASTNVPCVIGITPDMANPVNVALWVQITPDTVSTQVSMAIWGTVNNKNATSGATSLQPGPLSIPIGEVWLDSTLTQFVPYQEVFDHINNRYPPGTGNFIPATGISVPQSTNFNYRGTFQTNSMGNGTVVPTDLMSQIFYPGDLITFTASFGGFGFTNAWQGIYMFSAGVPAFMGDPVDGPESDSNWTRIMLAQYPT